MEIVEQLLDKKGRAVHTVSSDATVYEALEIMAARNIGAVIVIDEAHNVKGIFSERDYARKDMIKGREAGITRVKEIMTSRVLYVQPTTPIQDCMALMTRKRVRHLPVMENGELVGIVSIGDVVKELISLQENMISRQAFQIEQLERYISDRP